MLYPNTSPDITSTQNPYFSKALGQLNPLPYPVYFVSKDPKWQPLIDDPSLAADDSWYKHCMTGHDMWSAQVFLDLRRSGLEVYLVDKPVPGQICVVPYYYLLPKDWLFRSYVVGCRYDTPAPRLCNQRIVMNTLQLKNHTYHFLPHRPQPHLKPRNPARGSTLENLVFKGHSYNLAAPFRTPEFSNALQSMGIQLRMSTEKAEAAFADWADYTDADVVIAVRNNTAYDIALKPALKLINAWFAGCPAILGPEPAYQAIRRSPLDYIEVRAPEEAITALQELKNNPKLYQAMIENGFQRGQEYTVDRIVQQWHELLSGSVAQGYEQWLQASPLQKQIVRPMVYGWQILQHRLEAKHYRKHIHHGPRVLDTPATATSVRVTNANTKAIAADREF